MERPGGDGEKEEMHSKSIRRCYIIYASVSCDVSLRICRSSKGVKLSPKKGVDEMARSAATSYVPVLHPRHRMIDAILAAPRYDLRAPRATRCGAYATI